MSDQPGSEPTDHQHDTMSVDHHPEATVTQSANPNNSAEGCLGKELSKSSKQEEFAKPKDDGGNYQLRKKRSASVSNQDDSNKKQRVDSSDDEVQLVDPPPKEIPVTIDLCNSDSDNESSALATTTRTTTREEKAATSTPKPTKIKGKQPPPTPTSLPRKKTTKKSNKEDDDDDEEEDPSSDDDEEASESDYEDTPTDTDTRTKSKGRINSKLTDRQRFDLKIKELKSHHKKLVTKIRTDKDQKLQQMKKEYDTKRQTMLDDHKAKAKSTFRKFQDKLDEHKTNFEERIDKMDEVVKEAKEKRDAYKNEAKEKVEKMEAEVKKVKEECREAVKVAKEGKEVGVKEMKPEHSRVVKEKEGYIRELEERVQALETAGEARGAKLEFERGEVARLKKVIDERDVRIEQVKGKKIFDREICQKTVREVEKQFVVVERAAALQLELRERGDRENVSLRKYISAATRVSDRKDAEMVVLKRKLQEAKEFIEVLEKDRGEEVWQKYAEVQEQVRLLQMEMEKSREESGGFQTVIGSLQDEVERLLERVGQEGEKIA